MTDTNTPRTDEVIGTQSMPLPDWARMLERELAARDAELAKLKAEVAGYLEREPCAELARLKEVEKKYERGLFCFEKLDNLLAEVVQSNKYRDEARDELDRVRLDALTAVQAAHDEAYQSRQCAERAKAELDAAKEQAAISTLLANEWEKRAGQYRDERDAAMKDAERYRLLRECLFWRTDPFASDTGARGIGYWQTKLFKLPNAPSSREQLDAAIDAMREGK